MATSSPENKSIPGSETGPEKIAMWKTKGRYTATLGILIWVCYITEEDDLSVEVMWLVLCSL